jgi:hypothetical protein
MQKRYYVLMAVLGALFLSCGLVAPHLPVSESAPFRLIPWGVAWDYHEERFEARDIGRKHPMICEGERTWTVWEGTVSGGGCFVEIAPPAGEPINPR